VDDLREQRLVEAHAQAGLGLEPLDLGKHRGLARLGIDDDVGRAQGLDVPVGARDLDPTLAEEPVATALAARGLAGPLKGHDVVAEQRDEPLHGPHEADLAPAPQPDYRRRMRDLRGSWRTPVRACPALRPRWIRRLRPF
jgi:hypothetical protein